MADLTSFLQNGQIPAGSALTSMTKETQLPAWFMNYAQQLIANQNAASAQPYQTYQGPRVAALTPQQQQSMSMTGTAATAYQPGLNSAATATQAATAAPGGVGAAQPWMDRAGQSGVAHVQDYMNPYNDAVTNRIAELGTRNLTDNIMPGITSKFINAGQLGFGPQNGASAPTGMMTDTARAVRDTSNDILGQQNTALQQGYNSATALAQNDLSRYQSIGTTMGSLGQQQQQTQLAGAAQEADIAGLQQKYGLTGADAMMTAGKVQQGQTQQNLDVGYQDSLRQQGWSQEQINNALNTFKGVQGAVPTATTEQGISPTNQQAQYSPSTASTVAGTGLALVSALKDLGVKF